MLLLILAVACNEKDTSDTSSADAAAALDEFSDNVTIYSDGDEIVFESNGMPDHTSPYWSEDHALYVAPTEVDERAMTPGQIDEFVGTYTLRVPASPEVASASSSTPLGPIGIAVSGAVIYNDQEGQNQPIDQALVSLDYTGAHIGPQSYHYHLEPHAWSEDDEALIGIMADGFLLYGRRCASTGDHPGDLDASGGHTATTQHSDAAVYHYHIENVAYQGSYYILFQGDFQGSPSSIE